AERRAFQDEGAAKIVTNLIDCALRLKRYAEAEAWQRKLLPLIKDREGGDSASYGGELSTLAHCLLLQKKWSDAEPVLRQCLALREKLEPDTWTTFNTRSMLGGALLGRQKYAEA